MRTLLPLLLYVMALGASAETHALLIGVNRYEQLPPRLQLRGASNDVALMREVLLERGVQASRILLLARDVPAATAAPTLPAIRGAMATLRRQVRAGDHVVLHLAGHGLQLSQAGDGDEADGLSEVFLAEDAARWTDGRLPGALTDQEIGAWMDALVDAGARVFAVVDSCHAAGLTRSNPSAGIRSVVAAELGVPTQPKPASRGPGSRRLDGRVLALAARSHELTGEEWLPRGGGPLRSRRHGAFSFHVSQALRSGASDATGLERFIAERYLTEGRRSATPQLIGSGRLF